jgi:hypothetical protein
MKNLRNLKLVFLAASVFFCATGGARSELGAWQYQLRRGPSHLQLREHEAKRGPQLHLHSDLPVVQ